MITRKPYMHTMLQSNMTQLRSEWTVETMIIPTIGFALAGILLIIIFVIICTGYLEDEEDDDDFKELPIIPTKNNDTNTPTASMQELTNRSQTDVESILLPERIPTIKIGAINED